MQQNHISNPEVGSILKELTRNNDYQILIRISKKNTFDDNVKTNNSKNHENNFTFYRLVF